MRGIWLLMTFTLTFIACNKNDYPINSNQIGFITNNLQLKNNLNTKGKEFTNENINSFGIYAYYHSTDNKNINTSSPNLMLNQKVEKNNLQWTYSPIKYWPKEGSISFCAYSPYNIGNNLILSTTLNSTGYPQITYITPDSITEQTDLLISTPLLYQTKNNLNENKQLLITFKHALSSINIQAKMSRATEFPIKIKSIKISNIENKASYNYNTNSWDILTDSQQKEYTCSIDNGTLQNIDISQFISFTPIITSNNYLMLIPQNIKNSDVIKIEVEMYTQGNSNAPIIKTKTTNLNTLIPELVIGERYNINLDISTVGNLKLTCNVEPWSNKCIAVPDFN